MSFTYLLCPLITVCDLCRNISSMGQDLCFVLWRSPGTANMPGTGHVLSSTCCTTGWTECLSDTGPWAWLGSRWGASCAEVPELLLQSSPSHPRDSPQMQVFFARKTLCPGAEGSTKDEKDEGLSPWISVTFASIVLICRSLNSVARIFFSKLLQLSF